VRSASRTATGCRRAYHDSQPKIARQLAAHERRDRLPEVAQDRDVGRRDVQRHQRRRHARADADEDQPWRRAAGSPPRSRTGARPSRGRCPARPVRSRITLRAACRGIACSTVSRRTVARVLVERADQRQHQHPRPDLNARRRQRRDLPVLRLDLPQLRRQLAVRRARPGDLDVLDLVASRSCCPAIAASRSAHSRSRWWSLLDARRATRLARPERRPAAAPRPPAPPGPRGAGSPRTPARAAAAPRAPDRGRPRRAARTRRSVMPLMRRPRGARG
jgi:hypothetical protein